MFIGDNLRARYRAAAIGGYTPPAGQLPAGHYVDEKFSMVAVYPRPDSETGTFGGTVNARHRWAHYDGINPIQYEVPVKVFGGSPPLRYTLIAGPTGATIGNTWNAADHGVVKWTPNQSYSMGSPATFTVRVIGQDGVVIGSDITWTVATTTGLFLSPSGNDSTGDGSFANPWQTLEKVMGATSTTTTYPGRIVYMRAGTYSLTAHSDSTNAGNGGESVKCRIELSDPYHPMAYLSYPGESVTISMTSAQFIGGRWSNAGGARSDDLLFSGSSTSQMILSGSATNAAETFNFFMQNVDRYGWQWVTFDGFEGRTAGNETNSSPIHTGSASPYRFYGHAHGVREINRTVSGGNAGVLWVHFSIDYWVDEYCTVNTSTNLSVSFKDTCYHTSSRYADVVNSNSVGQEAGWEYIGQSGSSYNEVCYSRIIGALWFNTSYQATDPSTIMHSYRNSVYTLDSNQSPAIPVGTSSGTFTSTNDCLISNGLPYVSSGGSYPDTPGVVTRTGAECSSTNASSDKPFNTSTGNLQDGTTAWRTLYLGTRGWEIA